VATVTRLPVTTVPASTSALGPAFQAPLRESHRLVMMLASRRTAAIVVLTLSAGLSVADPINPADVHVVDGDTIRVAGNTVRLVGFDAPELGSHAQCGIERIRAARASSRLRQLIRNGGDLDLKLIPCSCRAGHRRDDGLQQWARVRCVDRRRRRRWRHFDGEKSGPPLCVWALFVPEA
jgi:endonuclease YncB( thermonuclease family)